MIDLKGRNIFFDISVLLLIGCLSGLEVYGSTPVTKELLIPDSIEKQILYNGRAWRNLYIRIKGDPFLFTTDFLPGAVTIGQKTFDKLKLKYDIFNDELLIISDRGLILQLNYEMIDFFSLSWLGKEYRFRRIEPDSVNTLTGFINVLYEGTTPLYIKYKKEILLLAVDNKYDMFNQLQRVYVKKDGKFNLISSRRDFLNQLKDHKQQVKSYIRSNKLRIIKKDPLSFKPVLEYYDKLRQQSN